MGGDFSYELQRANVLVGDNYAGKTRVINCVALVLLGYVPAYGKTPRDAFLRMSSGTEMDVDAELTDGNKVYPLSISMRLVGNAVKVNRSVPDFLKDVPTLAVMLDAAVYFGLGDTDRIRYVYDNCPAPEGFSLENVTARVEKAAPGWLAKVPPARAKEIEELSVSDAVEHLGGLVNEDFKKQKDYADRMEEMIRGLSGLRAGEEAPETVITSLQDRRGAIARELAELNEKKGVHVGQFTAMRSAEERRKLIDREIERTSKDRLQSLTLTEKLDLAEKELKESTSPTTEALRDAQKLTITLREEQLRLIREQAALAPQILKIEKDLGELMEKTECPYCGACGETWKNVIAAELTQKVAALKHQEEEFAPKRVKNDKKLAAAKEKEQALLEAQKRHVNLTYTRDEAAEALKEIDLRLARVNAMVEERKRLTPWDAGLNEAIERLQKMINVLNEEARRTDDQIALAQGRQHELGRLAKAEKDRDDARKDQATASAAGKELKAIKAEMVEAAFRPLLERANQFFPKVVKTPLEYDAAKGEIGTRRDGLWVGHPSFSGVEKALCYAAIQASLAQTAPVRVMIVDELGRLRTSRAKDLKVAVDAALNSDLIDQFIGIDPERGMIYAAGKGKNSFQVIEVS